MASSRCVHLPHNDRALHCILGASLLWQFYCKFHRRLQCYVDLQQARGRLYLILAAAGSLVVALLYLVNAYCSCIQLRTGTVDFAEVSLGPGHLFVSTSDHPKVNRFDVCEAQVNAALHDSA